VFERIAQNGRTQVVAETRSRWFARRPSAVAPPPAAARRHRRHKLIVLPRHGATRRLVDRVMAQHSSAGQHHRGCQLSDCQHVVEAGVGVAIVHSICLDMFAPAGSLRQSCEILRQSGIYGRVPTGRAFPADPRDGEELKS